MSSFSIIIIKHSWDETTRQAINWRVFQNTTRIPRYIDDLLAEKMWGAYFEAAHDHPFFCNSNEVLRREIEYFKKHGFGSPIPTKTKLIDASGILIDRDVRTFAELDRSGLPRSARDRRRELVARFVFYNLDEIRLCLCGPSINLNPNEDSARYIAQDVGLSLDLVRQANRVILAGIGALFILTILVSLKRSVCRGVNEDVIKSIVDPYDAFDKTSDKRWEIKDPNRYSARPVFIATTLCVLAVLAIAILVYWFGYFSQGAGEILSTLKDYASEE